MENLDNEMLPAVPTVDTSGLATEAVSILQQAIAEADTNKVKDLTYLFNINQTKKTMVRVNKLSDLLDKLTDQAITRIEQRPDNLSNQELMQSLKIVQDALERGQKQVAGTEDSAINNQPFIQINQQNNEIHTDATELSRESRENVKNAVMSILSGLGVNNAVMPVSDPIILEQKDR